MPSTRSHSRSAAALFLGVLCLGGLSTLHAALAPCKFNFGEPGSLNTDYPAAADYITMLGRSRRGLEYLLDRGHGEVDPLGRQGRGQDSRSSIAISSPTPPATTPGLQDCNVGTPDLLP